MQMYKNTEKFDINIFATPDASYSPVYVWVWNDICSCHIIDQQLAEMQNLGIRAFYILPEPKGFRPDSMPTNLEPDYLTDEFFELCAYAVQKHLKKVCDHLGYENISTHSFRKWYATEIYKNNGYDIALVQRLLQHSSAAVTQRYIGIESQRIERAIEGHAQLI